MLRYSAASEDITVHIVIKVQNTRNRIHREWAITRCSQHVGLKGGFIGFKQTADYHQRSPCRQLEIVPGGASELQKQNPDPYTG